MDSCLRFAWVPAARATLPFPAVRCHPLPPLPCFGPPQFRQSQRPLAVRGRRERRLAVAQVPSRKRSEAQGELERRGAQARSAGARAWWRSVAGRAQGAPRPGSFGAASAKPPSAARHAGRLSPAGTRAPDPASSLPAFRPGLRCCCDAVSAPAELGGLRRAAGTVSFLLSHRTRLRGPGPPPGQDPAFACRRGSPRPSSLTGRLVWSLSSQVRVQRFGRIVSP